MERTTPIIRFGNDGWHARFDEGFDSQNVIRVADALGLLWADAAPDSGGSVYVGFDTRHRSEEFAREVAGAIASYGLAVKVSSSPCPTPVVGWNCAHDPKALGGVVITSSERSCEYGGLIVRGSDGGTCAMGATLTQRRRVRDEGLRVVRKRDYSYTQNRELSWLMTPAVSRGCPAEPLATRDGGCARCGT